MSSFFSTFAYQRANGETSRSRRAWQTGVVKRAPVSGLLALILAVLCGISIAIVLVITDNLPLGAWQVSGYNVQPAVVLSILATLANAFLRHAFDEGVSISWWLKALRGGTLGGLHRYWNYGQSSLALFTWVRHYSRVTVASFCMLVVLVDGPLLQRASVVTTVTRETSISAAVPISASPFMTGATGIWTDHAENPDLYHPVFAKVLQQYNNRNPITISKVRCKGKCEADIVAAGWNIDCDSYTTPFHLPTAQEYDNAEAYALKHNDTYKGYNGTAMIQTMFSVNVTYMSGQDGDPLPVGSKADWYDSNMTGPYSGEVICLSSMRKATPGRTGSLAWRDCILSEATQRYPITITNGTLTMRPMPLPENFTVQRVIREPEQSSQGDLPSTVGGLYLALKNQYAGKARMERTSDWFQILTDGQSANAYLRSPNPWSMSSAQITWDDPIEDMMSMIRELSLRTAIATTTHAPGPVNFEAGGSIFNNTEALTAVQPDVIYPNLTSVNRTLHQQVKAVNTDPITVYKSHFGWLGGGLGVMFLAYVAVLPLLWGWWHLGRPVSMSPIETAKAFNAPLLRDADGNGTSMELLAVVGDTRVRYGGVDEVDQRSHNAKDIYKDHKVVSSGDHELSISDAVRRRLVVRAEGLTEAPLDGEKFI